VNVGGNSAIRRITVSGQDINDIIITAQKTASQPPGVALPDNPVYQYIEVIPARYAVISAALIEFDVPLTIADQGAPLNNVGLCMLNNTTWRCLPTVRSGNKNGNALYRAESPEFSLFAITIQNMTGIASRTITPAISPALISGTGDESPESDLSDFSEIPVKITPTKPDTGFLFPLFIISITGILGVVIGMVLIYRIWVH
jgi:PGF-pre-PGF domain-containing protein